MIHYEFTRCGSCGEPHTSPLHACPSGSAPARFGHVNDRDVTDAEIARSSERMGRELVRLFGLDPDRYSASYLRGAAQAAAGILGRCYTGASYAREAKALLQAGYPDPMWPIGEHDDADLKAFLAAHHDRCVA